MKKNILIIILFCLILLPISVKAGTRCSYRWFIDRETVKGPLGIYGFYIDKKVVLETEDNSNVFTKITDNGAYLKFKEEVKLNDDGSCPVVAFYHGGFVGNRIYSSMDSCTRKWLDGGCTEAIETELIESDQSSGNIAGEGQAMLDSNSSTGNFCRYKAKYKHDIKNANSTLTIYIHKKDFKVEANCEIGGGSCYINGGIAEYFPYDDFSCGKYIYYSWEPEGGLKITGKGTDADKNQSGTYEKPDIEMGFDTEELECSGIFSGKLGTILKQILNIVKFLVPILIIGLSIVDFVKALAAQSQDEIKKASQKLVKRLIIGIVIFVLPTLLEFLLKQAGIEFGICDLGK